MGWALDQVLLPRLPHFVLTVILWGRDFTPRVSEEETGLKYLGHLPEITQPGRDRGRI